MSFCRALSLNIKCCTSGFTAYFHENKWPAENFWHFVAWGRHKNTFLHIRHSLSNINFSTHHSHCYVLGQSAAHPRTHFTRAPPSPAKNRYLNSRLMILHASELATELFDEVQSPRCTFAISITTAKLPEWSHHVHGITQYKMASIIQLTKGRDREIAGLILLFRKKWSSKGTSSKYFTAICGHFVLGTACVKALGWLKKKEEEKEDGETRFSPLPGSSL